MAITVALVRLPLPPMPYVVQSPMPQLAERVALPNRRKAVWGIRLPTPFARWQTGKPAYMLQLAGCLCRNRGEISPVIVHSLRAVSGSICHRAPSQERRTRAFLGDYGHFLPLFVFLRLNRFLSSVSFLAGSSARLI